MAGIYNVSPGACEVFSLAFFGPPAGARFRIAMPELDEVDRSIGKRIPGGNIFASATGVDEHLSVGYGPAGCAARSIRTRTRPGAKLHGSFARLATCHHWCGDH